MPESPVNSPKKLITNEVFSLRSGERVEVFFEEPADGCSLALMARSLSMPPGPRWGVRQSDGAPVEDAAIVAAQRVDDLWQWVQLSPPTKEYLGDLLFDNDAEKDRWYYLLVT